MMIDLRSVRNRAALVALLILAIAGCTTHEKLSAPLPSSKGVNGFVQKGPFVSGSTITIQILDSLFNPTGQSYSVTTIDDFGSFNLQSQISGSYVELIAQGYYFNEVSGLISGAPLTLRAICKIKSRAT